jgi:UDP-N-acetylmuramyl pentapeptide synthase
MASTRPGRKVLIVADIPRLAQLGDSIHEEVLPHIDDAGFEHVITVGPHLANVASKLSTSSSSYNNRFHALAKARELLADGDTLFIKGNYASKFKDIMDLIGRFAELDKVKQ